MASAFLKKSVGYQGYGTGMVFRRLVILGIVRMMLRMMWASFRTVHPLVQVRISYS